MSSAEKYPACKSFENYYAATDKCDVLWLFQSLWTRIGSMHIYNLLMVFAFRKQYLRKKKYIYIYINRFYPALSTHSADRRESRNNISKHTGFEADDILKHFYLFLENRIWHFMQIVSNGDNLHEMSNPVSQYGDNLHIMLMPNSVFWEKY